VNVINKHYGGAPLLLPTKKQCFNLIENNIEEFNSIFDTFLGVEVHDGLLKNLKISLVSLTNTPSVPF